MPARLVLAVIGALALSAPAALQAEGLPTISTRSGLTVALPAGWRVVHERLTPSTNPLERLTVAGRGALVMLQESLDPRRYIRRFAPRPRRFELRGRPQLIACCAPPNRGRGWFFNFRDGGRGFYAYVYLGEARTRDEALRILDSLRVRPS
jgi:hypothetical protein